jgi:predicted dehydrogenase
MTQRRYHPAFLKIKELVGEVSEKTSCPITSFQTTHCDGQWRMPSEIVDQNYHPYNRGYGKCSHSGYHSIDIIDWLIRYSYEKSKQKSNMIEVISNFTYPNDFISQIPLANYKKYFDSDEPLKYNENILRKKYKNYGEIDAQIELAYKNHHGGKITTGQFSLLHNSFSQRNWASATGRDLYKGNGRIRHEIHYIVQGPFQTILFESLQSEEILNEKTTHSNVGGEYHLDVHVFRNSKLFPEWKTYEKITVDDLDQHILKGYSRGHQEDARRCAITTFIKSLNAKNVKRQSDLKDQKESIAILEAIYDSAYRRKKQKNPLVKIKTDSNNEK